MGRNANNQGTPISHVEYLDQQAKKLNRLAAATRQADDEVEQAHRALQAAKAKGQAAQKALSEFHFDIKGERYENYQYILQNSGYTLDEIRKLTQVGTFG